MWQKVKTQKKSCAFIGEKITNIQAVLIALPLILNTLHRKQKWKKTIRNNKQVPLIRD